MIESIIRWLIKKYIPGYHLRKNPERWRKIPSVCDGMDTHVITEGKSITVKLSAPTSPKGPIDIGGKREN